VSLGRFEVLMAGCLKNTIFGVTLNIETAGFSETLVLICTKLCGVTSQESALGGYDDQVLHINIIVYLFQYWYR
jgi:hypothetical protein